MNDFYQQLNRERESNRWAEWQTHRTEIIKLIHLATRHLSVESNAIIMGAGNCDDLEIVPLTELFEEMTLADIDLSAMMEAVRPLDLNVRNKIQLVSTDFTKLDEINFYRNLKDLLNNNASGEHIVRYVNVCADQLREIQILSHFRGRYQVVISSALYTQLFYMNALQVFAPHVERYKQDEIAAVMNSLINLRNVIIQNYNDILIGLAVPHAVIVVWSDVLKTSPDGKFMETVNSFETDTAKLRLIMNEVKKTGRLEGMFGLQDMQTRLASHGRHFAFWNWPYSSKNHCLTFGIAGTKAEIPPS